MSKDFCSYHSTRPAVWYCGDCCRDFCDQCVIVTHRDRLGPPDCPLCDRQLEYLGAGNVAQPFWSVAPRFLLFPFGASGLGLMLLLSGLSLLMPLGLLGLFVLIFAIAVCVKYGFSVLEAVAMGAESPPPLADAISGDEEHLFLKLCGVLIAIGFIQVVAEVLISPGAGALTSFVVTIVMPAIIVLLAVTKSIEASLSPARIYNLIFSIGWPYLLAVFLTNVISTGPYLIAAYGSEALLESALGLPLFAASVGYFVIVNFAMLGYVLYEHQSDLGFVAGDADALRLLDSPDNIRKQLLAKANVLAKEDRQEDVLRLFRDARRSFESDLAFNQRYFDFAREIRDTEALAPVAAAYLELLMTRDAVDQALDVWRTTAAVAPGFRPENPETVHVLAQRAHSKNLNKEALALLANLHKHAPDYRQLPAAYALAADILREGKRPEKAAEIEDFVRNLTARRDQAASGNLALRSSR